jgi:CRP-like cAMP-binding protein
MSQISRACSCEDCPLRKNPTFRAFTSKEIGFVEKFKSGELAAEAGSSILSQGANAAHIFTVLKGWGYRYKTLEDGRVQILNFILPGDLIGLQGVVLEEMGHSVGALTDMLLCVFERKKLWTLYEKFPALAYDITWLASREEQLLDEHLVSLGRRTAIERIAFVLLLLNDRAIETGEAKEGSVTFPFTQQHLADTLGLSLVHTNKTLRKLTDQNLIRWKDSVFEIGDRDALATLANYEYPSRSPRPFI